MILPEILTEPISIAGVDLQLSAFQLLVELLLPGVVFILFSLLIRRVTRKVLRRSPITEETQARILRALRLVLRLILILFIGSLVARLLGTRMVRYFATILRVLNQPFYESGGTSISIVTIILILPVVYVSIWSSKIVKQVADQTLKNRVGMDPSRRFSIVSLLRYLTLVLVLVIGLSLVGINISSLAVIFGVLGIGLGFGLQEAVGNFFAGLVIILSRPVKEGDRILVQGIEGTVVQIKLLSSVINTITNETIILPNAQIAYASVHNYSYDNPEIIIRNYCQVSYASDLDQVVEVMQAAALECPFRLRIKEPVAWVWSFDESGVTMMLSTWISNAEQKNQAFAWLNLEIWRAFKRAGVEIPFPQRDVHLKSLSSTDLPPPGSGEERGAPR
ncbi:MAG: mechanosensitive ion channel family protein [Alkalispirochaetaceae bacterium]